MTKPYCMNNINRHLQNKSCKWQFLSKNQTFIDGISFLHRFNLKISCDEYYILLIYDIWAWYEHKQCLSNNFLMIFNAIPMVFSLKTTQDMRYNHLYDKYKSSFIVIFAQNYPKNQSCDKSIGLMTLSHFSSLQNCVEMRFMQCNWETWQNNSDTHCSKLLCFKPAQLSSKTDVVVIIPCCLMLYNFRS